MPEVLDTDPIDEVVQVTNEDASAMASFLLKKRAFSAVSLRGRRYVWAAVDIGNRPENKGKQIVVVLPDTGEHYLSTDLMADA